MGWFKKKKKEDLEQIVDIQNEYEDGGDADEEEILRLLNESDDFDEDEPVDVGDTDFDDNFDDDEFFDTAEDENIVDAPEASLTDDLQVTKQVSTYEELSEFVNAKPIGYIQYMRKDTKEVFQLRDAHLRIARVWGSVSINKQYSDRDYARIMLALEILENPDDFFVLPMFTDSETQAAIMTFCQENFGENGKKYVKNTERFAKLINENDMGREWNEYTEELIKLKLERFCTKNGIFLDN